MTYSRIVKSLDQGMDQILFLKHLLDISPHSGKRIFYRKSDFRGALIVIEEVKYFIDKLVEDLKEKNYEL